MSQKPKICPKCKSTDVAEIVYGCDDNVKVSKEEYVHSVCYLDDVDSPQYYCNKCYHKFGKFDKGDLYLALRNGDIEKVKSFIKQGVRMPSLLRPIYSGNKTALKTLILAGGDVNVRGVGGQAVLFC